MYIALIPLTNALADMELRLRNAEVLVVESFLSALATDIIFFLAIRWSLKYQVTEKYAHRSKLLNLLKKFLKGHLRAQSTRTNLDR